MKKINTTNLGRKSERYEMYGKPKERKIKNIYIKKIEKKLRDVRHLSNNERLFDRINIDKKILKYHGLNKHDIFYNHKNFYITFRDTGITINIYDIDPMNNLHNIFVQNLKNKQKIKK